jgi:hypothetical protein
MEETYAHLHEKYNDLEEILQQCLADHYGDQLSTSKFSLDRYRQEQDLPAAKELVVEMQAVRREILVLKAREETYRQYMDVVVPGRRVRWTPTLAKLRPRNQRFIDRYK